MKVSVIGLGHVGSAVAYTLLSRSVASELMLVSGRLSRAEGEAADLTHANALLGTPTEVVAGEAADTAGSGLIVLCHSVPTQRAGRYLLAEGNGRLFRDTLPLLAEQSPNAIFLVVSNPVDALSYVALRATGFPPERVFGAGTVIDSGRFRAALSEEEGVHPEDVRAYVLGEHGDTQFAALSLARTGGVPLANPARAAEIFEEVKDAAYYVFQRKGYTNYAIAAAVGMIAGSIAQDECRTMPVSVLINGYLGVSGVCLSLPCVVGRGGVHRVLHPELTPSEADSFRASAQVVRTHIEQALAD
ncbi:L-lactate dehydrogenase [Pirellulimonas nuda]|uniref:L-lactate dehydrogenase n=1 Tax=Pirellulimonas nuda TaxID=2528009 RepID=A0A518DGW3_9BACT|nr:lactate dehydrogenase [Pirellulimonas nuda]QDU90707.1 L-lactate dehydrogenase [Pirellulimonas nuda]